MRYIAAFFQSIGRGLRTLANFLGALAGGLYLLFLYGATAYIVVGTLSAIQIQDEVAAKFENIVSFRQVLEAEARLKERIEAEEAVLAARDEAARYREERTKSIYGLSSHFEIGSWYQTRDAQDLENQVVDSERFVQAQYGCEENAPGLSKKASADDLVCRHINRYNGAVNWLDEYHQSEQHLAFLKLRSDTDGTIATLRQEEELSPYFHHLDFFRDLWLYWFFLTEPRAVLVMQLTIIMGALGSVITMTWSFVRRDEGLTLRRFLILPFVGSMSAFIILVFLKAGQLTLAGGAGDDALSPFFLSFIGIISGLLSERAYARMSEIGTRFFSIREDQPRWSRGLRRELDRVKLTPRDFAGYLHVSKSVAEELINNEKPASLEQQRLIAALFRKPIRDIFSDLPPARPNMGGVVPEPEAVA